MIGGCLEQVAECRETNRTQLADLAICTEAENMCRDNVEGVYYGYGGRGAASISDPLKVWTNVKSMTYATHPKILHRRPTLRIILT